MHNDTTVATTNRAMHALMQTEHIVEWLMDDDGPLVTSLAKHASALEEVQAILARIAEEEK